MATKKSAGPGMPPAQTMKIAGFAVGGFGVAAVVVGALCGVLAKQASDDLGKVNTTYNPNNITVGKMDQALMFALVGVGGAAVIVGAVWSDWAITRPSRHRSESAWRPASPRMARERDSNSGSRRSSCAPFYLQSHHRPPGQPPGACFNPSYKSGQFFCSQDNKCPSGDNCSLVDVRCYLNGSDLGGLSTRPMRARWIRPRR